MAGCGPGADLETFAQLLPEARITGIELFPHLAEEARARLAGHPNVRVEAADMAALAGPADLIWSAGALYFLGVTEGLSAWRPALAQGGAVAFSEPVLLGGPRDVADRFWSDYPAISDMAGLQERVEAADFMIVGTRLVTGAAWTAYYAPLEARIAALRPDAGPQLAPVLDATAQEIALWRSAPEQIAYALLIVCPT